MLRDRLRSWGANSKAASSNAVSGRTQKPAGSLAPPIINARHANILSQLDRFFELAWQRQPGTQTEPPSDLVGLVSDFNSMAMVAIDTGRPQAWAAVNRTSTDIAAADWSTLSADQITAIVLTPPPYAVLYPGHPANVERRQTHSVLRTIIGAQLAETHPLILFMEETLHGRLSAEFCYFVGTLDEWSIRKNAPSRRLDRVVAESKRRLASILLYFREYRAIDDLLGQYDSIESCRRVPLWAQGYIQTLLGRSKFAQDKYAEAAVHFKKAEAMDDAADLISTIYISRYGAASLLRQRDVQGAEAWLRRLLQTLQVSVGTNRHVDSECLAFDIRCLCDHLYGCSELEDVLHQLALVDLGRDESRERELAQEEI